MNVDEQTATAIAIISLQKDIESLRYEFIDSKENTLYIRERIDKFFERREKERFAVLMALGTGIAGFFTSIAVAILAVLHK